MPATAATEMSEPDKGGTSRRAAAVAKVHRGDYLTAAEFAAVLEISIGQFYRWQRSGVLATFEVRPQIGPLRFAGARIARHMAGEAMAPDVLPRYGRGSRGGAKK